MGGLDSRRARIHPHTTVPGGGHDLPVKATLGSDPLPIVQTGAGRVFTAPPGELWTGRSLPSTSNRSTSSGPPVARCRMPLDTPVAPMADPQPPSRAISARFEPYPEYKDSDVGWLGRIPAHWDLAALRYRYEQTLGKMLDTKRITGEHLVPYLRNVDVQWDRINLADLPSMDIRPQELERFTVQPGDLLVCEGGEAGRCAIWYGGVDPCGYQKALHRLRPLDRARDNPRFLYYTLVAAVTHSAFAEGQGSTIGHVTGDMIRAHRFPFPLPPEQHAIADFLDRETAKIDALVTKQERLVDLLREKRAARISQAVTKGVDTAVPMKDSGVEWLGEIPAHWTVVQLRRVALDRCDGPFGSGLKSSHYAEEGVRVVRLQNIGHGEFDGADAAFIPQEHCAKLGDHSVIPGDLLIAGLGDTNHPTGRACAAPADIGPAMVKADCFRFRLDQSQAQPQFLALQLTATASIASGLMSTGATRQRTSLTSTAARAIAIPDLQEQSRIVDHITRRVISLDHAQDAARRGIDLLTEYRTALISAAVRGKIDVRDRRNSRTANNTCQSRAISCPP